MIFEKKNWQDFLNFLKTNHWQSFNFFLIFFFFIFLPFQFDFQSLKTAKQNPLYRELEFELPKKTFYPLNITAKPAPLITAKSCFIIDTASHAVIYQKEPDYPLSPASTTKLLTALVVLDNYQPQEKVKVSNPVRIGQTIGLKKDEVMTIENLLYGLLVQSGNDAAFALADNYKGGRQSFVKAMNDKAKALHLEKSHFTNPAGIDEDEHFSTSHDLAILASEAIKNPLIKKIVKTQEIIISDVSQNHKHYLKNINLLLGKVEGLKGIKTGWTDNAGECLITLVERENKEIIIVILGSADRFTETTKLIDWVFANFVWQETILE